MRTYSLLIINIFNFIILTGCASFYDVNISKEVPYKNPISIQDTFYINGRFSIKTMEKHYYGNFTWQKEGGNEELYLTTPLGQVVGEIKIENGAFTLTDQNKNVYSEKNLDSLLEKNLGFTLPLSNLHYWIQGVPLPGQFIQKRLKNGFTQLGWDIRYLEWNDKDRPNVVQCVKGSLQVKLVIKW